MRKLIWNVRNQSIEKTMLKTRNKTTSWKLVPQRHCEAIGSELATLVINVTKLTSQKSLCSTLELGSQRRCKRRFKWRLGTLRHQHLLSAFCLTKIRKCIETTAADTSKKLFLGLSLSLSLSLTVHKTHISVSHGQIKFIQLIYSSEISDYFSAFFVCKFTLRSRLPWSLLAL